MAVPGAALRPQQPPRQRGPGAPGGIFDLIWSKPPPAKEEMVRQLGDVWAVPSVLAVAARRRQMSARKRREKELDC